MYLFTGLFIFIRAYHISFVSDVLEVLVFFFVFFMGGLFWLFIAGLFCYICILFYLRVDPFTYASSWSTYLCRI